MSPTLLLVLALACSRSDVDSGTPTTPPDLSERLDESEARVGVITDDRVLFEGISAEGRVGDLLLYNNKVRFVLQGLRPGSFYMEASGQIIDADIVREPGQLGRDAIEDWFGMAGVGRLLMGEQITIVNDGSDGAPAHVRVQGSEGVMRFINGAVEGDLIRPIGLDMTLDYRLPANSHLLEVTTTITATNDVEFQPLDLILGAQEVMETWYPGQGLAGPSKTPRSWTGYVSRTNTLSYGMFPEHGVGQVESSIDLIAEFASGTLSSQPSVFLAEGERFDFVRYYGVGPDLATLSDAWLDLDDAPLETVTGVVHTAEGPVAGARVNVLVDDAPYTLAVTKSDGSFSAQVPASSSVRLLADGRGPEHWIDHAQGAVPYSHYGADPVRQATLAALTQGAPSLPSARGYGVADPSDPLTLQEPATLHITDTDGLPVSVWLTPVSPSATPDPRLAHELKPQQLWSASGELSVPIEPGTWSLLAHRGTRYEVQQQQIELVAGETLHLEVQLAEAYVAQGYLAADPHVHASPSQDASVSMEDRLVIAAAHGLQLHFGTDHDHVADYRPLIGALGLSDHLNTVVASEMSPVLRGHFNLYPLTPEPSEPNSGAWSWWAQTPPNTEWQMEQLREHYGSDYITQSNHPLSSGLASQARWSPGTIGKPDKWTTDLQAMEVCNNGNLATLAVWQDLVTRGWRITPTATSDSHGHTSGGFGLNTTFIGFGTNTPSDYTDELLIERMTAMDVVASRGPFIESSLTPGSQVEPGTEWTVTALSPSWIEVDRLSLYRNAELVEVVEGTTATFVLDPEEDALYTVHATGDRRMAPVFHGHTPWAMTAPVYVDVHGDGWTPPLPPLTLEH